MSAYTEVKTQIRDISCLKRALMSLGFEEHMIEISETPMELKGYGGDIRKGKKACVRIRGAGWNENYVGGASNDLGFERMEDGTLAFHVSEYDARSNGYGTSWQKKLIQNYAVEIIKETAETSGYSYDNPYVNKDGSIVLKVTGY